MIKYLKYFLRDIFGKHFWLHNVTGTEFHIELDIIHKFIPSPEKNFYCFKVNEVDYFKKNYYLINNLFVLLELVI